MKKLYATLFSALVISIVSTSHVRKQPPANQFNVVLLQRIDSLQSEIDKYILLAESKPSGERLISQYKKVRTAYKQIEAYVVFRYPTVDKHINGGPVPGIEMEVAILHKSEPTGLQVIEELLVEDKLDHKKILRQIKIINEQALGLKSSVKARPFQSWEVLEANHMAITRLITLGLSGFDSPAFLLSLEDARTVLQTMKQDLKPFRAFVQKGFHYASVSGLLDKSIQYLDGNDFNGLDRFTYYRDYLLPLQAKIWELHRSTGYETYDEVSNIKRSLGGGKHLFSENYLDPYYSLRGTSNTYSKAQEDLGKILFFDPILSGNNKRACSSCHRPEKAFTDGAITSIAFDTKSNILRNSPTLLNSCFQTRFFYDMRSHDMNNQITNVIGNKDEFNTTADEIIKKLQQSEAYKVLFKNAFPGSRQPVNINNVKLAIEIYVRSLVGLNSRFDQNIRNEVQDFTAQEILGANIFLGKGACATCHFPPGFNGFVPPHYKDTEGEVLGVTTTPDSRELDHDKGIYDLYKGGYPEASYVNGMFKTPTVRNIELTAPYMHNGTFKTLEEVVDFYNEGGALGRGIHNPQQTLAGDSLDLSKEEKDALIAFMKTLTDTSGTTVQLFALPRFENEAYNNRKWGGEY